jgi:WD40 repeat protein
MHVIDRMMAKKPKGRFETPIEVAIALERFTRPSASDAGRSRTLVLPKRPKYDPSRRKIVALAAALFFIVTALLSGAVYRIATDKGELVIETNDEDVEVVVRKNGKEVKIIDTKTGKSITLDSGEYDLGLKEGQEGLKISPEKIVLKRGKSALATITRAGDLGGALAEGPPAKKPPDGLIAWWRADGNAKDSAEDNHGTLKGGVTFAQGVAGKAFRLDGATRYVEVPRSDLWGFGRRDFSIELWVQFRALTPSRSIGEPNAVFIGCDEGGGPRHKWFFAYAGGFLNFTIHTGPGGREGFYAKADFSPDVDQWYHLAVTRSRGMFTIYVNGSPVASEKDDIIIPNPDAPLSIGQTENLGFFSGLIDEIAIYNRALSPEEVKARWSALAPSTEPAAENVGDVVRRFPVHQTGVNSVAISPDGRLAASGGGTTAAPDFSIRLWDMAGGHEIRRLEGHGQTVQCVVFSPDGQLLASAGSHDQTVRIWEVATGNELHCLRHNARVDHVAFLTDGRHVLSAVDDGSLRMWDVKTGKQVRAFEGHKGPLSGVAVSPDGRRIASASQGRTPCLWDAKTGEELRQFAGHSHTGYRVAFSPDGRRLLSTDTGAKTVRLWDVESGKELRQFVGHTGPVHFAVFTTDGRRALSSGDGTIRLWDVETGKELHCFKKPGGYLAVSPDGRHVLYGDGHGAVLLRLPDPPPTKENP